MSTSPYPSRASTGTEHSFPGLIAAFNAPPTYGDDIDLAHASMDDVSALLLTFLDCLPGGGIVPAWARPALGRAMSMDVERDSKDRTNDRKHRREAIRAAQMVLRLLPAVQFSLLVYILAFLSQVPLHEAWNGWSRRGVARAFARVVVGVAEGEEGGKEVDWVAQEEDAVMVLEWLLASWDDLSDGLFVKDAVKDEKPEERERGESEKKMHRAAAMRNLDPSGHSEDASQAPPRSAHAPSKRTSPRASTTPNPNIQSLLDRIASLERTNAAWQHHEASMRAMFVEADDALLEERAAVVQERAARISAERAMTLALGRTEDAVLAERRWWAGEVHALREGWERLGKAWEGVGKESEGVGRIVREIVGRVAENAPAAGKAI
ncbi:hypothetical protein K439DRAFT_494968 [Ramaria rubella]|nr:hypothetical protein K439DRAFT_494968 [Ramaria rubella]